MLMFFSIIKKKYVQKIEGPQGITLAELTWGLAADLPEEVFCCIRWFCVIELQSFITSATEGPRIEDVSCVTFSAGEEGCFK